MSTRPLRRGQRLWTFTERLHIPVPLPLKAHVLGLARESGVSVAAWGYGIVMTAVKNPEWLAEAMAKLHELQAAARASHCYGVTPPQSAPSVAPKPDPTFAGTPSPRSPLAQGVTASGLLGTDAVLPLGRSPAQAAKVNSEEGNLWPPVGETE